MLWGLSVTKELWNHSLSLLNKDLNPKSFPYGVARKAVADALGTIVETEVGEKEKKNIIKFLTSNDPALVKMGITMLKGILVE